MREQLKIIDGGNNASLRIRLAQIGAGILMVGGIGVVAHSMMRSEVEDARIHQQAASMYPLPVNHVPTSGEIQKLNDTRESVVSQLRQQDPESAGANAEGEGGLLGFGGGVAILALLAFARADRPK